MQYFDLAGNRISFIAKDRLITTKINELLRYHIDSPDHFMGPHTLTATIELFCDNASGNMPEAVFLKKEYLDKEIRWTWQIQEKARNWSCEEFYYWVLLPVLRIVLAELAIIHLHGALLFDPNIGGVLILGQSRAGKSTVTASWLNNGGYIVTDDIVLLKAIKQKIKYSTGHGDDT